MRKIAYEVKTRAGITFTTNSYTEATAEGNRIVRTFLTPVDMTTKKEKDFYRNRVAKLAEKVGKRA